MTATQTPVQQTLPQPLTWASPEAKLWVASRGGDFAGYVEFNDGHYEVTDGRGTQLQACATLRDAKALLALPNAQTGSASESTLVYIAVVTGAVAFCTFAAGMAILWMG